MIGTVGHVADKNESTDKEISSSSSVLDMFKNDEESAADKPVCNFTVTEFKFGL